MLHKKIVKKVKYRINKPLFAASAFSRELLKDEAIGGKLVIAFSLIAIILVNSVFANYYFDFLHTNLSIGLGNYSIEMDLKHWVSEGLMTIFFLVVGLEIKREIVHGELRYFKKAILPIAAAIGGMAIPALVYVLFNSNPETITGWGIPMATDIAFAVAVLSLLGNRVPINLKLFLLTLAVVDDIGAIFVIALFYAEIINWVYLAFSVILVLLIFLLRKYLLNKILLFSLLGLVLWFTMHKAGVHASIVGAFLGLLAPTIKPNINKKSLNDRLEEIYLPFSTFIVLPAFALASAGVLFRLSDFQNPLTGQLSLGIILGLVVGKLVGIAGASWLMVRLKMAQLPKGVNWYHIIGVALIAGTGFTVSIFITELVFADNEVLSNIAKISVFIGSVVASIVGSFFLIKAKKIQNFVEDLENNINN